MNRPELYQETVNTLLDAYNADELFHGNCSACAVGNICANASLKTGIARRAWSALFTTAEGVQDWNKGHDLIQRLYMVETSLENVHKLIDATGYTVAELGMIEFAFEKEDVHLVPRLYSNSNDLCKSPNYKAIKESQFKGLSRVLDVLKEIHSVDLTDSQESQTRLETIASTKFELV